MNTNLPLGGSYITSGTDRIISTDGTLKASVDASTSSDVISAGVVPTLHTPQELKQAELRGDHVSLSDEQFIKAVDKAVKAAAGRFTTFEYSVHKETKQIMVKVLDKDTGEMIREIPPEKNLDFVAKMMERAGLIVDERR